MAGDEDKASEYWKQAADCLTAAQRMSRLENRIVMLRWAVHWLELAREAADEE
jgi:hypothetical protein